MQRENEEKFADRLILKINESAMSKTQVAKLSGIHAASLSRLLSGAVKEPNRDTVNKLAVALNLDANWLAHGSENNGLKEDLAEYNPQKNKYLNLIETNLSSFDLNGILDYIELLQKETPPGWAVKANVAIELARKKLTELNQS